MKLTSDFEGFLASEIEGYRVKPSYSEYSSAMAKGIPKLSLMDAKRRSKTLLEER
jgi:hypothetical protein